MKGISLMAVAAMMTTGAFASTGNGNTDDIALNKMEIQQQKQQNDDLESNITDQQQAIFDLVQQKTSIQYDMQLLEERQQRAEAGGNTAKANRIDKRIAWDQALLKANEENIREYLAVERNDMRLMNHNGERIDNEEAAIAKDKE
jgi:hypothetical protein